MKPLHRPAIRCGNGLKKMAILPYYLKIFSLILDCHFDNQPSKMTVKICIIT
jgi:hypothetical protein